MFSYKLTNHSKILTLMSRDPNKWWLGHDFMKPDLGELFVGYLAPRRLRELRQDYPDIFETEKQGKQIACRLDIANIKDWYFNLPSNVKKILRENGLQPQVSNEELLANQGLRVVDEED